MSWNATIEFFAAGLPDRTTPGSAHADPIGANIGLGAEQAVVAGLAVVLMNANPRERVASVRGTRVAVIAFAVPAALHASIVLFVAKRRFGRASLSRTHANTFLAHVGGRTKNVVVTGPTIRNRFMSANGGHAAIKGAPIVIAAMLVAGAGAPIGAGHAAIPLSSGKDVQTTMLVDHSQALARSAAPTFRYG